MKVLLLAGGSSSERSVSLRSGKAMFDSLKRIGHGVAAYDPSTANYLSDPTTGYLLPAELSQFSSAPDALAKFVSLLQGPDRPELVVSALHGGSGEGGHIQALLELSDIPYVGSSMTASAITMDKALTKQLMRSLSIPTADWRMIDSATQLTSAVVRECSTLGFPFIVKPNDGGSTVGLTKVLRMEELAAAIELSRGQSPRTIIEAFIAGRELTATVLHGETFPLVEIRPKNELYDFEAKYTKGMSDYICPAPVDNKLAADIQKCAALLYATAGCTGVARADFMLREDGAFFCLEINTLPGMTELSLAPMAAKAAGMSFDQLIASIVEKAVNLQPRRMARL